MTTQQASETFTWSRISGRTRTWAHNVKPSPPKVTVVSSSSVDEHRAISSRTAGCIVLLAIGTS
ncbi:hypothetical protein [Streptomyces aquilus]|uniref:hypothetical protein n=1 Tax=Streptomyces aquilus TaxID=2548456 RepID=UPI003677F034